MDTKHCKCQKRKCHKDAVVERCKTEIGNVKPPIPITVEIKKCQLCDGVYPSHGSHCLDNVEGHMCKPFVFGHIDL